MFQIVAERADAMLRTEAESLRREFRNTTIKGSGYERKLVDVVVGLLPQSWRVGSGEVVDPYGRRSGQTDLVVALPSQPSLLHSDNGDWIFLSPAVVAIGETKLSVDLDGIRDFVARRCPAWGSLDRGTSGMTMIGPMGADNDRTWGTRLPVFLFAHEGPPLESILSVIAQHDDPPVDAVFVRNRGAVLRSPGPDSDFRWVVDENATAPPAAGTWISEPEIQNAAVVRIFLEWIVGLPVWQPFEQRPLRRFLHTKL